MNLEKIVEQKITKYKSYLKRLLGEDKFNCGRAMEVENTITELEEILSLIKQSKDNQSTSDNL